MNDENCIQIQLIYCVPITFSISNKVSDFFCMDNKYRVAIRIPYLKLLMRNVTSCYAENAIKILSLLNNNHVLDRLFPNQQE